MQYVCKVISNNLAFSRANKCISLIPNKDMLTLKSIKVFLWVNKFSYSVIPGLLETARP